MFKYVLLVALFALQVSSWNVDSGCSCWTRACNFCRDTSCAVKYDLSNGEVHIISQVDKHAYNKLSLFDKAGKELGIFGFNRRRFILTGCIQMYAHSGLGRALNRNGQTQWYFSMSDNTVRLRVGSSWEQAEELIGDCKEIYSDVAYFAFTNAGCMSVGENNEVTGGVQFSFNEDNMEYGPRYKENCNEIC